MTTTERAKRWYAIALLALMASACGAKDDVQSTGDSAGGGVATVEGTGPLVSVGGSGGSSASGGQGSSSAGETSVAAGGAGATGSVAGGGSGGSGGAGTRAGGGGTGGSGNGAGAGGGAANPSTGSVETPSPSSQSISFPPIGGGWTFGETRTLSATASSGLAVTFSASGACQVTNAALGVVLASDVGDCRVTASQPGGAGVQAAAPVTQSTQIGKATPAIQFADQRFEYDRSGAPVPLSATVSNGVAPRFRLVSDDPNGPLCTVDGDQLSLDVPNTAPARCVIEAYVDATGQFEAASASATFTVEPTFVTFTSHSDASVSADGASASVTVSLNRVWGIDFYSDCDGSSDSQSDADSYTVTVSLPATRPLSCTITVSTSQPDGAVTADSVSVPVSLP